MRLDAFLNWLCETKLGLLTRVVISLPIAVVIVYGLDLVFTAIL